MPNNTKSVKYLPTDVSDFHTMVQGNYLYVDKTHFIYKLFSKGKRYYFLSRPRRFGKTLLISTLKEFFSGNKELFKGLWLYTSNHDWAEHPVIHLDFSTIAHRTPEHLEASLRYTLETIAQNYTITLEATILEDMFTSLIRKLSERNKVAILIDEYDYPLLSHLHDIEVAKKMREILKSFYGVLKGLDPHLRAIFITGVSKFSKTSIFSGLNNLDDLTLDPIAASLLGYTQEELETYFSNNIAEIAEVHSTTSENIREIMKIWYHGYRFSSHEAKVYNPYSILYYLDKKELKNYWFESGTPFFLIQFLKKHYTSLEGLEYAEFTTTGLGTVDLEDIPPITLLFQTGYLTIINYDSVTSKYKLGYPNKEVHESFQKVPLSCFIKYKRYYRRKSNLTISIRP